MIKVAIDLTWVRHGVVGGTEVYAKNMIDGFVNVDDPDITYILLTAKDNKKLYEKYIGMPKYKVIACNCLSAKPTNRLLWQNTKLQKMIKNFGANIVIEPMYLMPFIKNKDIHFITAIHDLQAAHYPQYFSKARVLWMKTAWENAANKSDVIIVSSEYSKKDIASRYDVPMEKMVINYNPVAVDVSNVAGESKLKDFGVEKNKYYYMVTSLLPHKNIETVVKVIGELKRRGSKSFYPLVVSGVGGKSKAILIELAKENNVADAVILTPFINDSERNLLYKNCKTFLAPSLFEGFGMPPLEAMIFGVPLLSTHETCSYEVSNGIAEYVENAKDPMEWADKLDKGVNLPDQDKVAELKEKYSKENIAKTFNHVIKAINNKGE